MRIDYTKTEIQSDKDWIAVFKIVAKEYPGLINQIDEVFASIGKWINKEETAEADFLTLFRTIDGRFCKLFASEYLTCTGCTPWDSNVNGNVEFYDSLPELLSHNTITQQEADAIGLVFPK